MIYPPLSKMATRALFSFCLLMTIISCNKSDNKLEIIFKNRINDVGTPPPFIAWVKGNDIPVRDGIPGDIPFGRYSPFGFTINGKGYMGGGLTVTSQATGEAGTDFWEFDPTTNTWSQKADYPGAPLYETASFVIGNQAYVCTGTSFSSPGFSKENWQYDQPTNTWTRKADFGGVEHRECTAFASGGKGYLGLGYSITERYTFGTKDWWQYDPATDTWTKKADFPGGKRQGAAGFVINNKGYVCSGHSFISDGNTVTHTWYNDLWKYNPSTDTWTQKADLPSYARELPVAFSAMNMGIIATGEGPSLLSGHNTILNDCWEYDATGNKWYSLPNVGGGGRYAAFGFAIGNSIYIGAGTYDFFAPSSMHKDFWSLTFPPN
jgi:N-acetylneuraminic acid mutarotase